jgi:hypothetical protein
MANSNDLLDMFDDDKSTTPITTFATEVTAPEPIQPKRPPVAKRRRLVRKEAQISPKQYMELTKCARELDQFRGPDQPRITENTLIRIFIVLGMKRAKELQGVNEEQLRQSIGL